ncbi:MAG: EAL domain-containing protein [Proteobacteria bacterium]|nr:EAL domain-containing protein [Pseudomonadota bacterium]
MMNVPEKLKIIIIDDNPAIHQDFLKILTLSNKTKTSRAKFTVNCATEEKALEKIKEACAKNQPYAIAFVDIGMPLPGSGIEIIKQIFKVDANIQVVCSANVDYAWDEIIKQLGMSDNLLILNKPFDKVAVRQLAWVLMKKWQLSQEIEHHLSLIRATIESSFDGILVTSNAHKIVDYNINFFSMWHLSDKEMMSINFETLLENIMSQLKSPAQFLHSTQHIMKNSEARSTDLLMCKDGRIFERYSQPHRLNGVAIGRIWFFRDITKRYLLEKKLEHQASHDTLTDLPNRVLLYDRIKQGIAIAKRHKTKLGVIFLDIDRFKLINDSLGHQAGDQLLVKIAKRLRSSLREIDTLARLGGDEFVVVILDLKKRENFYTVANKLLETFKYPFEIVNRQLNISTSLGISVFPDDAKRSQDLLRNADLAMYRAKKLGLNKLQFYKKDMGENAIDILEIESQLRSALLHQEFFLVYQAQYNTAGRIMGTEVLLRWHHPQKGLLLPMDFIPQAETSGLIIAIGEWVLTQACLQCKAWHDMGLSYPIAVNVAAQQLRQHHFVKILNEIIKNTAIKPEWLELEITENVIFSSQEIVQTLQEIRKLGIRIVLDNFGTGNTSLNYLAKVTFDRLKIDRSYIANIGDLKDKILVKSIIAMARSLGLHVVAQGVETLKQLDFLQSEGCSEVQGYYFSKPLPSLEYEKILKDNLEKH